MKNKVFKIVLALVFAFCIFGFFGFMVSSNNKVYAAEIVDSLGEESNQEDAEEQPSNNEEATEETAVTETSLTEEEKGKLDKIVEWLSNLNKEELLEVLATAKNWLIAGGIVTVISILSAVIGLIAAILKLQRQKVISSDKEEKQKQKELERIEHFENMVKKGNDNIKMLILNLLNNATDEEKKAMEANIDDVRTKIELALQESNKNE